MRTCAYCTHAEIDDLSDEMNSYSPETIFYCAKRNKHTCELTPACEHYERRMPCCAAEADFFYENPTFDKEE